VKNKSVRVLKSEIFQRTLNLPANRTVKVINFIDKKNPIASMGLERGTHHPLAQAFLIRRSCIDDIKSRIQRPPYCINKMIKGHVAICEITDPKNSGRKAGTTE